MTRQSPLLVLRADAGSTMGAGHVMRCLALAQAWRDHGGEAVFVGTLNAGALQARIEGEGAAVFTLPARHPDRDDLATLLPWLHARRDRAGWLVVDGYHFDPAYHQALRGTGWPLLIIDDSGHLPAYHADVVVNPNAYAGEISYLADAETLLLRGTRFALLRREFRRAIETSASPARSSEPQPGGRILVTMGGADPDNVSAKVIDTLAALARPGLEIKIIAGALNPHRHALAEQLRQLGLQAELVPPVADMTPLMAWADLAISAAGSTCWELAALGVAMVVTVVADNQERVASSLAGHGAAINLGWFHGWQPKETAKIVNHLLDNSTERQAMGQRGHRLVDGQGCERLLRAMRGCHFSLRPATADDCEIVFRWANDPTTRAISFSPAAIPWEEHRRWFFARLADPGHLFAMAITPDGEPMAQARFALDGSGAAVISVSLAPEFRGVGLGSRLIRRACEEASTGLRVREIRARIKPGNSASLHAFGQAGFQHRGVVEVLGQPAVAMEYCPQGIHP